MLVSGLTQPRALWSDAEPECSEKLTPQSIWVGWWTDVPSKSREVDIPNWTAEAVKTLSYGKGPAHVLHVV